jgi:hypothetical protein
MKRKFRLFCDFRVSKNLTDLISSQSSGASETFSFLQGTKASHFPFFHNIYKLLGRTQSRAPLLLFFFIGEIKMVKKFL